MNLLYQSASSRSLRPEDANVIRTDTAVSGALEYEDKIEKRYLCKLIRVNMIPSQAVHVNE